MHRGNSSLPKMKKLRDPSLFEGISKHCIPVNSDEDELENCPFTHEYVNSPISSPSLNLTPGSQATGIIMISVSTTDSDTQSSSHEVFETPPELKTSSETYFSGNDDPKPSGAVDIQHDGDTESTGNHDTNTVAVDLASDSDDLGFSNKGDAEEQMRKKVKVSQEHLDLLNSLLKIDEEEQSEMEIHQTQQVDTEVVMECEENLKADEQNIVRISSSDSDSSTVKMSKRSDEEGKGGEVRGRGDNEKMKGVIGDDGGRGVECMKLDKNEKMKGVIGDNGGRGVDIVNLDKNEKSNGIGAKGMPSIEVTESSSDGGGASGSVKGRRQLPASMRGGDKKVEVMDALRKKAAKTGKFKDLMEVLSMVVGDAKGDDNNGDFFETAIRCGVTFPRPRWWPPGGFDG